jgi:hypothetical protein
VRFAGLCGYSQRLNSWKKSMAFRVAEARCDFLATWNGLNQVGGTEVKSDAITTRFLTFMAFSYGYTVNARILTVGFCMGCLDDARGLASLR